jgi:hypothetical protein
MLILCLPCFITAVSMAKWQITKLSKILRPVCLLKIWLLNPNYQNVKEQSFIKKSIIKSVTYLIMISIAINRIFFFSSLANLCLFWANILDLNHVQKSLFLINNTTFYVISIRYLSRFFDCLVHPNLSATLATDQK